MKIKSPSPAWSMCMPVSSKEYEKKIAMQQLGHNRACPPYIQGPCQAIAAGTWWPVVARQRVRGGAIITALISIREICTCRQNLRCNNSFGFHKLGEINLWRHHNSDISEHKWALGPKLIFVLFLSGCSISDVKVLSGGSASRSISL